MYTRTLAFGSVISITMHNKSYCLGRFYSGGLGIGVGCFVFGERGQ